MSGSKIDALSAIVSDLDRIIVERRRHFTPALIFVLGVLAATVAVLGLRHDLWVQPWWQLAAQIGAWAICLVVFPSIGVGLWFPSPRTRILLATGGTVLALLASFSFANHGPGIMGPCPEIIGAAGVLLLGVGAISGAFAERQNRAAIYWIAAAIGLASLDLITWICPNTHLAHLIWSHLVPTMVLILIAIGIGRWLGRDFRSSNTDLD